MHPATVNPMDELIRLVTATRYEDLPAQAIDRAKAFLLDTLGVGIAGNRAPFTAEVVQAVLGWGVSAEASVLGSDLRLPAPSAALVNGYRIHSQEFDCVFEAGVIIPMGPLVAAILAHVERRIARGESVSGRALILALVVGVEISCTLGLAAKSGMKFFRPGTTGGFSALAALCVLDQVDSDFVRRGFGIVYSQISGSMQSHEEGSSMLAMQIGFNARAALTAFDLARAGLSGPLRILDGRFGYFPLFESEGDMEAAWAQIAKPWKITRLSHKPYPSGRVTHGMAHAMLLLRGELTADAIARVHVAMPPLGFRLVGRPIKADMMPNYARLCVPYVASAALIRGAVGLEDFLPGAVGAADVFALGARFSTSEFEYPDPNAFYPQRLRVETRDGRVIEREVPYAPGHPEMPLSDTENLAKFRACLGFAGCDAAGVPARTIEQCVANLESQDQLASLTAATARLHP